VHDRHADVHQHDVGREVDGLGHCLGPVVGLGHHVEPRLAGQDGLEAAPEQLLVVGHYHGYRAVLFHLTIVHAPAANMCACRRATRRGPSATRRWSGTASPRWRATPSRRWWSRGRRATSWWTWRDGATSTPSPRSGSPRWATASRSWTTRSGPSSTGWPTRPCSATATAWSW